MDLVEIIILIVRAISRAMNSQGNPPPPKRPAPPVDEVELIRRRIEFARQQKERGVLVAQLPPPARPVARQNAAQPPRRLTPQEQRRASQQLLQQVTQQANRQAAPQAYRQQAPPQRMATKRNARASPPAPAALAKVAPKPAAAAPAPPSVTANFPQQKLVKKVHPLLNATNLRAAIIASEVLQPPMCLRD